MNRTTTRTLLAAVPILAIGGVAGATMRPQPVPTPQPVTAAAFLPAKAPAAPPARPAAKPALREEARALWVNRWDYGDAESIRQVMEVARRGHFNMVFFQVRGPSDARYRSALDPCSPRLCGRLGGVPTWDPLEVAVREAHARGLQLHAWLNALSGWESTRAADCGGLMPSLAGQPNHELIDHPEWAMVMRTGARQHCPNGPDVEYIYLSPGNPGVRTHLAQVAADVVRRYDVDGVHLDRIRYPGADYGWDRVSLEAFGRDPSADPAAWAQFRRGLVSKVVREVHDSIQAVRHVPLSAAVWPIYDRERFGWPSSSGVGQFFQDTWGWASEGSLDAAVPMTYFYVADEPCSYRPRRPGLEPNPDWACMVADHVAGMRPTGRFVYAGILAGLPFAEIEKQIRLGRERGVNGFSLYSYGALQETGAWRMLADGPFREPATVPAMPWLQ